MIAPARSWRALARGPLALGLGLLGVAAPALAVDPGTFAGESLSPATNVIEATPIGSGLYTLSVPEDGVEQFVEVRRQVAGSTLWYGASAILPKSDDTTSPLLILESSPNGSGDPCVGFESLSDGLAQSTFSTRLFTTGHRPACQDADSLVLRTAQDDLSAGSYQLVAWEEPPLEDGATLPDRSETVPWASLPATQPEDLAAGTTYSDAPEVSDGTYAVHVDPGEPALIKVPLSWGQHAQAEATTSTQARGYASVSARWLSPLGGVLGDTSHSGGPSTTELALDGTTTMAGWVTPSVAWRNREGPADQAPAAIAGDYYLSIDTPVDQVPPGGVDLVVSIGVVTDYPATAPAYTQEPPALPYVDGSSGPAGRPTSGSAAGAATTGTADAAEAVGPGGTSWTLVGGLFGAAVLLTVAGVVALTRRERTG